MQQLQVKIGSTTSRRIRTKDKEVMDIQELSFICFEAQTLRDLRAKTGFCENQNARIFSAKKCNEIFYLKRASPF
jgi:hypothetical protein